MDTHFSSYEEVQKWVDEWIALKDTPFYSHAYSPVAGEMEKSNGKWRTLLSLRYLFIFPSKQIHFGDENTAGIKFNS